MTVQTRVKERAEEQASAMTPDQQAMIRMVANDLHRLNQSVMKAVEAGVSVELVRSARHHGGEGNWGDLLIPVIVSQGRGCNRHIQSRKSPAFPAPGIFRFEGSACPGRARLSRVSLPLSPDRPGTSARRTSCPTDGEAEGR